MPISELLGGFSKEAYTYATFGYPFFDEQQIAEYARSSWPTGIPC